MTLGAKPAGQMKPDEACCAGDQYTHRACLQGFQL
jgi:hypothetical protein